MPSKTSDVHHFAADSPEGQFYRQELLNFILRTQRAGFGPGEAASMAVCLAGYIVAAYVDPKHTSWTVAQLQQILATKTDQALGESSHDRDLGLLPPWPKKD